MNVDYLYYFIREKKIDVIVNQAAFSPSIINLLGLIKVRVNVKIITCYHNSILTPVYNYAYQKELYLRAHHLSLIFKFLKRPFVNKMLVGFYINKYRNMYLQTLNVSDRILLLCREQVPEYLKMCGLEDYPKISVIENFGDTKGESTVPLDVKQNIVLWVGTFDYSVKRPDQLLKAWKLVYRNYPEWKLQFLGDGLSLNYMKQLSSSLDLQNVEFVGRVNPEEYYSKSKILVNTSSHEAFPMTILEAKSKSIPLVAYKSFSSLPTLTRDGYDSIWVDKFDSKKLASALARLMSDETFLKQMSINARNSLNQFSEDVIYNKWQKLFESI
ncbi:MAG: glycosyltransferase [Erysipelotrichia bacterium]|nr:glycosyltransferase [Erysipelotrichia bacterium]